jgi:hypothetical protein
MLASLLILIFLLATLLSALLALLLAGLLARALLILALLLLRVLARLIVLVGHIILLMGVSQPLQTTGSTSIQFLRNPWFQRVSRVPSSVCTKARRACFRGCNMT